MGSVVVGLYYFTLNCTEIASRSALRGPSFIVTEQPLDLHIKVEQFMCYRYLQHADLSLNEIECSRASKQPSAGFY